MVLSFSAVSVAAATTVTLLATRPTPGSASSPIVPNNIVDIVCPSTSDCFALGVVGGPQAAVVLGTTDGGAIWTEQSISSKLISVGSIACMSTTSCVLTAYEESAGGWVVLLTTDGGNNWAIVNGGSSIGASPIQCPTSSECVTLTGGTSTNAYVTTDGGETWNTYSTSLPDGNLYNSISCASASDCEAVGYNYFTAPAVIAYTTDAGQQWAQVTYPPGVQTGNFDWKGVSCPTTLDCSAVGSYVTLHPMAAYTTKTTDGVPVWNGVSTPSASPALTLWGMHAVSCPSTSECFALGSTSTFGASILSNGNPFSDSSSNSWAWLHSLTEQSYLSDISCPSTQDCIAVGSIYNSASQTNYGMILATTNGGNTWFYRQVPGVPFSPINQINYAALGDSYSSGEGTASSMPSAANISPTYLGAGQDGSVYASNTPSDQCHRSPVAYSEDLATSNGWNLGFYACSGATTNNILTQKKNGEPPQINDLSGSTNLVTLTIGGNNAGFAGVIKSCIAQTIKANTENKITFGLAGADPNCVDNKHFIYNESTVIANTEQALLATFSTIRAKVPNASIIVLDYPQLFPTHSAGQGCIQLIPFLTSPDQIEFNLLARMLDAFEHRAAYDAGVNFVDVQSDFLGHGACGATGAYINGITDPLVGSFHPNAKGQRAYAHATADYIAASNQAEYPETPQQLPQNPPPGIDPPGRPAPVIPSADLALIGQTPTQSYGNLTVDPLTSDFNAACEGQFQAGQVVQVNGSGYRPGANVLVDLSSPGEGSNFKHQVASLVANATGDINANVRIPLGTPGFAVTGQSENIAFLEATGTSATSMQTRHIDNAMFAIARPASQCGTVDPLGFKGFDWPVANPPTLNTVISGIPVPVRFAIPEISSPLKDVLSLGSPQSAPVSCVTLTPTGASTSTTPSLAGLVGYLRPDDGVYFYPWFTSRSWTGCRELTLTLGDGTVHHAYFRFVRPWWWL